MKKNIYLRRQGVAESYRTCSATTCKNLPFGLTITFWDNPKSPVHGWAVEIWEYMRVDHWYKEYIEKPANKRGWKTFVHTTDESWTIFKKHKIESREKAFESANDFLAEYFPFDRYWIGPEIEHYCFSDHSAVEEWYKRTKNDFYFASAFYCEYSDTIRLNNNVCLFTFREDDFLSYPIVPEGHYDFLLKDKLLPYGGDSANKPALAAVLPRLFDGVHKIHNCDIKKGEKYVKTRLAWLCSQYLIDAGFEFRPVKQMNKEPGKDNSFLLTVHKF